ncbi:MAG: ABC transporter ATP-binding protein [Promethearchaeota archaeon]
MRNVIETKELVKEYSTRKEKVIAVDGIDLNIPRGTIFSFLGPNGAGKTTTVRVLSCLLKPTAGDAYILGMSVKDEPVTIRSRIGVLSENHGLYENMTIKENVEFFAGFYGMRGDSVTARLRLLLEDFELEDRRDSKVGTLSKGLKQRASLIKTLIHDPEILFLDEPTSGLDPKAAVELRKYIKFLGSRKEKTIFICTHNLTEAQKLSDQVAIIDKGKIKRVGNPSELERELFNSRPVTITSTESISPAILKSAQERFKTRVTGKGAILKVYIDPESTETTTPEIIKFLVSKNVPITRVTRDEHSLEDVYLKLMEEG